MLKNERGKLYFRAFFKLLGDIVAFVPAVLFLVVCIWIFIHGAGIFEKIVIIPFIFCGLAAFFKVFFIFFQDILGFRDYIQFSQGSDVDSGKIEKRERRFSSLGLFLEGIFYFGFLLFWFGMLIFFDYELIRDWDGDSLLGLLFSSIFWIAGFAVIYTVILRFKKR